MSLDCMSLRKLAYVSLSLVSFSDLLLDGNGAAAFRPLVMQPDLNIGLIEESNEAKHTDSNSPGESAVTFDRTAIPAGWKAPKITPINAGSTEELARLASVFSQEPPSAKGNSDSDDSSDGSDVFGKSLHELLTGSSDSGPDNSDKIQELQDIVDKGKQLQKDLPQKEKELKNLQAQQQKSGKSEKQLQNQAQIASLKAEQTAINQELQNLQSQTNTLKQQAQDISSKISSIGSSSGAAFIEEEPSSKVKKERVTQRRNRNGHSDEPDTETLVNIKRILTDLQHVV